MKTSIMAGVILLLATSSFASEITEAEVRLFFNQWLATQNNGVYSSYASMYASKFLGIKRSGDRTSRYNHDTWLKDRKGMFKDTMNISASKIGIQTSEGSATVRFEQTWESNAYRDQGEKQLDIVLENDKLRIAREELLASHVVVGNSLVADAAKLPFSFAIKEGIVIDGIANPTEYMKGKPDLTSRKPYYVASALVHINLLPKNLQSLIGMKVNVYGAKGLCETKINGFKVVSKDVPHFGYVQQWAQDKTPGSQIAKQVCAEGKFHFVATTENCTGDFAKDARLPRVPIAVGQDVNGELRRRVWAAFKTLPLYKNDIKPYENLIEAANMRQFSLSLKGKTSKWVSVLVVAGEPQCGEEGGGVLGSLWEISETDKGPSLRWVRYINDALDYATDIDNDGIPDFHYKESSSRDDSTYFGFLNRNKDRDKGMRFEEAAYNDSPC